MQYTEEVPPPRNAMMIEDAASYRTSDTASLRSLTRLTEAQEAELLSAATSQAMIAARSIIFSGGSLETALSTAKAAAHSILVPNTAEMEGGPALGKKFLSRRKAKRQAEIVASMALLSVKQQAMQQPPMTVYQSRQVEASSFMRQQQQQLQQEEAQQYGRQHQSAVVRHDRQRSSRSQHGTTPMIRTQSSPTPGSSSRYDQMASSSMVQTLPSLVENEERSGAKLFRRTSSPLRNGSSYITNKSRKGGKWLRKKIGSSSERNSNNKSVQQSMSLVSFAERRPSFRQQEQQHLPSDLPKSTKQRILHHQQEPHFHSRGMTRDLAKSFPDEDPIYYNISTRRTKSSVNNSASASSDDGSQQTDDFSGTYGSDTAALEDGTVDVLTRNSQKAMNEPTFLNDNVDPFLATLTSVFFCGGQAPYATPDEAETKGERRHRRVSSDNRSDYLRRQRDRRHHRRDEPSKTESRNDEQVSRYKSPSGWSGTNEGNRRQETMARRDSQSTADGSTVMKDLNTASSDDDGGGLSEQPIKTSIRESMEQVVLRALSAGESAFSSDKSKDNDAKTKITVTTFHDSGNEKKEMRADASATSSLTASTGTNKNRLQALSQRVKFRRWMKKRKGQDKEGGLALAE